MQGDGPPGEWPHGPLVNVMTNLCQGHHLGLSAIGALPFSHPHPSLVRPSGEAKLSWRGFTSDTKSGNQGQFLVEVPLSLFGFKFPMNVLFAFFTRRQLAQ